MLIPSIVRSGDTLSASLSRRVNANSQPLPEDEPWMSKLIKKGEC